MTSKIVFRLLLSPKWIAPIWKCSVPTSANAFLTFGFSITLLIIERISKNKSIPLLDSKHTWSSWSTDNAAYINRHELTKTMSQSVDYDDHINLLAVVHLFLRMRFEHFRGINSSLIDDSNGGSHAYTNQFYNTPNKKLIRNAKKNSPSELLFSWWRRTDKTRSELMATVKRC